MKKEERDIFDDLVRSKLQDFEVDTAHDDWEAIVSRLPEPKGIPLRRRWPYWAAAAVVSLLVVSTGIYLSQKQPLDTQIVQQIEQETKELESQSQTEEIIAIPVTPQTEKPVWVATAKQPVEEQRVTGVTTERLSDIKPISISNISRQRDKTEKLSGTFIYTDTDKAITTTKKTKGTTPRKWSFGAGAGGFTESTGNVVNTYALRSNTYMDDDRLLALNAASDKGKLPKTNIKHKTPVSFGLAVSRRLNDRFSLQSGLTYTMLTSDWETQAEVYNNKTRQRLHFIGIPLSLTYKIAEWNRFNFYASAGFQTEINVAGQERVKSYFENQEIDLNTYNVRMKEWQWSTNARVGVSYPIVRYISAFAEVGAVYYFDNGSDMETIYSDKPFNVSPQVGFRFSF